MGKITAYKAFNSDFTCRGFQYEIGKKYVHKGNVAPCESGFHACKYPLDVLRYYNASTSRFALVTQEDYLEHSEDSKVVSAEIIIEREISLQELIEASFACIVEQTKGKVDNFNSGDYGAASNSGCRGAASNSGCRGAASNSGDCGAASNSGYCGAASNSGYYGAASNSGDYGAASNSGTRGAASNSGTRGAASNSGTRGAASNSGDYGAASNSGDYGAASNSGCRGAASNSGDYGAASSSGTRGAAMNAGYRGRVKGCDGSALFLVYRDAAKDYAITKVWSGIVGQDGIKPDVWYTLGADGKPVDWKE